MDEIALPHITRPVIVLITEPLTMTNRGRVARWLEDQGISVGVPPDGGLVVRARLGDQLAHFSERVVVLGRNAEIIDQAHYKLWYEPIDQTARTEPT